jgi:hypothetical protein
MNPTEGLRYSPYSITRRILMMPITKKGWIGSGIMLLLSLLGASISYVTDHPIRRRDEIGGEKNITVN